MANKILIVDDEPGICEMLGKILTEEGYSILTAMEGRKALSLAKRESPDLVILDLKMPGMGGIKILRQLKKINSQIEVIILTGYGDLKTAREAMRLGAYDYITKPFKLDFVKELIKEVM